VKKSNIFLYWHFKLVGIVLKLFFLVFFFSRTSENTTELCKSNDKNVKIIPLQIKQVVNKVKNVVLNRCLSLAIMILYLKHFAVSHCLTSYLNPHISDPYSTCLLSLLAWGLHLQSQQNGGGGYHRESSYFPNFPRVAKNTLYQHFSVSNLHAVAV